MTQCNDSSRDARNALLREVGDLEADRDRYRVALQEIVRYGTGSAVEIARVALAAALPGTQQREDGS